MSSDNDSTALQRSARLRDIMRRSSADTALASALKRAAALPQIEAARQRDQVARERLLSGRESMPLRSLGDHRGRHRKLDKA